MNAVSFLDKLLAPPVPEQANGHGQPVIDVTPEPNGDAPTPQ
jgi:hypothetical protein